MLLTLGNWIIIGIIFIVGIVISLLAYGASYNNNKMYIAIGTAITIILCLLLMFGLSWWNTSTASGQRAVKDYQSNINGGINREITITAEDGREIFHYEGKIDVETDHTGANNYILFESEEGLRYIIYYGVQDTVLIVEKEDVLNGK